MFAWICKNCRRAQPIVDGSQCQRCGDDMEAGELLSAFEEQGQELQQATDELAQLEEGVPA